jgi:hypothetical protein
MPAERPNFINHQPTEGAGNSGRSDSQSAHAERKGGRSKLSEEEKKRRSKYEVPVGKQPRIYKKGRKPPRGIDPKSFTPEFIKELTQGSKADRDIAAFRWLNARSESDEG